MSAFFNISAITGPAVIISLLITLRKGYVQFVAWIFVAFQWFGSVIQIIGSNGLESPALGAFTVTLLLAGFLINRRGVVVFGSLTVVSILAIGYLDSTGQIPPPLVFSSSAAKLLIVLTLMGVAATLLYMVMYRLQKALASSQSYAKELEQVIRQKTHAEQELKNALERERHLNEVTSAISSKLDLDTILSTVIQLTAELVDADTGAISLLSPDGQTISYHNLFNLPEEMGLDKPVPKGDGLSWKVIETGQSILLDDYDAYENALSNWKEIHLHSLIVVPLGVGEICLGTLSVANRNPDFRFSNRDLALVESIGRQTAIAIQNARLFESQQHEINERIRIEKEREALVDKLEEQNDELTRFTYTVSHDLRNPLVTIKGFLGMLSRDLEYNRQEKIQHDFDRISNAADKMDILLTDLLELSRIGRIVNPPIEIDTVRLIQDALDSVDARIRSRSASVNIAPDIPVIFGDRTRLREVFENLIDNAIKYMGDQTEPVIEIGTNDNSGELTFYVKDNGLGIEKKYHERIFGLFEKLNPTVEGTGIGLALVKRIIETHGGKIWVESIGLGKGSTFYFTLPQ